MVTWFGEIETMFEGLPAGLVTEKETVSGLLSTSPQKLQPVLSTKPRMVCGGLVVVRVVSTSKICSCAGATMICAVRWLEPTEAVIVAGLLAGVTARPRTVKLVDCEPVGTITCDGTPTCCGLLLL